MKKTLLHTFAILLSALMLIESVGILMTKEICTPCGESKITAQLIPEVGENHREHHICETEIHEESCCQSDVHCTHHDFGHEHQKEHYFFKNTSVFLFSNSIPELKIPVLFSVAPLLFTTVLKRNAVKTHRSLSDYPIIIPQNKKHSLLCTYLI